MGDAFPVSGNIDPASFPFLLVNLHGQGATGSLKVIGPPTTKRSTSGAAGSCSARPTTRAISSAPS